MDILIVMNTVMTITMNRQANSLSFVQAMDAFFPIGAYTMSNGMETYVQKQMVKDEETLTQFLSSYLSILPFTELGFAAHAAKGEDVVLLDGLCGASKSPKEIREGSQKLCSRFLKAELFVKEYPLLQKYSNQIQAHTCDGHFCIAVGLFIKELQMDVAEGLSLYGYNQLSAMVNHAVKLVPLRQLEGQRCLHQALHQLEPAVEQALASKVEELGASGPGFDKRCMEHETLYSRLYLS